MKKVAFALLALLVLVPLASAAWQELALISLFASLFILAVVYMLGMGAGSEEIKALSKDEFYQLIVLAILMVGLVAGDGILNAISQNAAFTRGEATIQDAATVSLAATMQNLSDALGTISESDKNIAVEASKSVSCTMTGGGYSVSACGGFTMLGTPFSLAGSIVGYSIAEVASAQKLIEISALYALQLLLPVGIILRTFRFTRGAGGFLLALGISAYIMLPLGIIFVDMLYDEFVLSAPAEYTASPTAVSPTCEGAEIWGSNEDNAVEAYGNLRVSLRAYLLLALVRATLGPVMALLFFVGGLRALTGIFGAEVDVSAIGRLV